MYLKECINRISFTYFFYITVAIIIIGTVDTHAIEGFDPSMFLLTQKFRLTIPGVMLSLLAFAMFLCHKGKVYLNISLFRTIVFWVIIILFTGFLSGRLGEYPVVAPMGPETRGLYKWLLILYIVGTLSFKYQSFPQKLIFVLSIFLIIRSLYEIFFLTGRESLENSLMLDTGHIIMCATISLFMLALFLNFQLNKKETPMSYLLLSFLFMVFVFLGTRRSGLLILIGGWFFLSLYFLIRTKTKKNVIIFLAIFATIFALSIIDGMFFNKRTLLRISSIAELNPKEQTSNYEHIYEIINGIEVIKKHPVLGAGTGTTIPGRLINKYGDTGMIPFHSPHIHIWVRLSIIGFLGYCFLQIVFFFKFIFHNNGKNYQKYGPYYFPAIFSLATYLFFQIAMPAFFIDDKQTLLTGVLLGIIIGLETRNNSKQK